MSKKRILHVELATLGGALQHFAQTWEVRVPYDEIKARLPLGVAA